MTYDEKKNISILMQVAYKGVIELAKTNKGFWYFVLKKLGIIKPITNQQIKEGTEQHYQMLTGLIERAQNPKAENELSNSDISLLEGLIDTSTLSEEAREKYRGWIVNIQTKEVYYQYKEKLEANQQSPLKERGVGSAKDIQIQLDKDMEDTSK